MEESKLITIYITISILLTYGAISGGFTEKRSNSGTNAPITSLSDIYTILIYGTVRLLGNCTKDVKASQVEYWLYTQSNSAGELLEGLEHVDSNKAVKVLIHGWKRSKDSSYMVTLKDAYLKRYDANIIVVNYERYAMSNYQSAYCNAPYVAQNIANFICQLETKRQVNISSIHIVGHSLGGQIAGMAGNGIQDKCNKTVGRITGLDPAGPLYQGVSPNARLDTSDATFVDVVHTNQGQFGYIGEIGHVDFYPNGGTNQPGCLRDLTNLTTNSIVKLLKSYVLCNHERSCYLFAESILVNSFYSTSVSSCFGQCVIDTESASHCYMGENLHAAPSGTKKEFTCSTNSKPKYGKGPDGPLM